MLAKMRLEAWQRETKAINNLVEENGAKRCIGIKSAKEIVQLQKLGESV